MLQRFLTDTLTNAVVLDDVHVLSTALPKIFLDGTPLRLLLHEKTHHASFDGPVGLALAALTASSALPVAKVDPNVFTLSQRDYLLIRQVGALLEPLIEGMAMFAEFDCIPGPAPVASAVSAAATRLLFGTSTAFDALRDLIWQHRMLDQHQQAKRELFQLPVDQRPRYLLGYLALKRLYFQLESRCKQLADSDLFMLLMLDYWFRDRPLAQRLLALDRNDPRAVFEDLQWVITRFETRLEELITHTDEYVTELVNWQLHAQAAPTAIGVGDGPSYRGPDAPDLDPKATLRFADLILTTTSGLLEYRTDFRFSTTALTIEAAPNRTARIFTTTGELAGADIPLVANAPTGTHAGALEGVLTPALGGRAVMAITGADGIFAVRDWGAPDWNPPDLVKYFDRLPSAVEIQRITEAVVRNQRDTQKLPLVQKYEAKLADATEGVVEHVYLKMLGLPPPGRVAFMTALRDAGLAGPLESDALLITLGRISARAGCHLWQFEEDARHNGWDSAALQREVTDINARLATVLGLAPLVVRDGLMSSCV